MFLKELFQNEKKMSKFNGTFEKKSRYLTKPATEKRRGLISVCLMLKWGAFTDLSQHTGIASYCFVHNFRRFQGRWGRAVVDVHS